MLYECACLDAAQASYDAQFLRMNVFLIAGFLALMAFLAGMLVWVLSDCFACKGSPRLLAWACVPAALALLSGAAFAMAAGVDEHRFFAGCQSIEP